MFQRYVLETDGTKLFFEEIGPDFGYFFKADMAAGPFFKGSCDTQAFSHEFIDAVEKFTEVCF